MMTIWSFSVCLLAKLTIASALKSVLYDMPVSNHGARVRMIISAKGIASEVICKAPSEIGGLASPEYKKLNPHGKMPLLVTDSGYPIAESDTISRYLIEKYSGSGPSFVPNDARLRLLSEQLVRQHDIYISPLQGAMYKAPGFPLSVFGTDRGKALDELVKQVSNIEGLLRTFDAVHGPNLRKGGYLCGSEISLADATIFPTMVFCQFMLPRFFDVHSPVPGSLLHDWFERLSSSDSSANQVKEEIETALRNWEAAKRWEPILDEKKRSSSTGQWGKSLVSAFLIGTSMYAPMNSFDVDGSRFNVVSVHADSTGKMSTKLTARKRYLPRITEGVKEFNDMAKTPGGTAGDAFLLGGKDSKLASLGRAMNLYGASLRKGEVPDAISREAEQLTAKFLNQAEVLAKTRSPTDASLARKALDTYLDFASLPKSSQ
jgi:glutathione S-transferase